MMRKMKWEASATEKAVVISPSLGIQFPPKIVERCSHYPESPKLVNLGAQKFRGFTNGNLRKFLLRLVKIY